jgi:hypothetical protein
MVFAGKETFKLTVLGQVLPAACIDLGLDQPAIRVVTRQTPGTMEHG